MHIILLKVILGCEVWVLGCDFRRVCQLESRPKMWQKSLIQRARPQEPGAHGEPRTAQEWQMNPSNEICFNLSL